MIKVGRTRWTVLGIDFSCYYACTYMLLKSPNLLIHPSSTPNLRVSSCWGSHRWRYWNRSCAKCRRRAPVQWLRRLSSRTARGALCGRGGSWPWGYCSAQPGDLQAKSHRGVKSNQGAENRHKRSEFRPFFGPFRSTFWPHPRPKVKPVSFLWHVLCIWPENSSRPMMA